MGPNAETNRQSPNSSLVIEIAWKSLVVGIANAVLVQLGGTAASVVGLPAPGLGTPAGPQRVLVDMVLWGILLGLTLGPIARRLTVPFWQRAGVLFTVLFGIGGLINGLDGYFFSAITGMEEAHILLSSAISQTGLALLLSAVYRPARITTTLGQAMREVLGQYAPVWTILRIVAAGLLYLPTFFAFGLLVLPYVQTYYEDPALGMQIPPIETILAVETVRGLLFVLVLLPLVGVMGSTRDRWHQWAWVALALLVVGAWAPMLVAGFLPLPMRIFHGMELTADCMVHSGLIVWLLGIRQRPQSLNREDRSVRRDVPQAI